MYVNNPRQQIRWFNGKNMTRETIPPRACCGLLPPERVRTANSPKMRDKDKDTASVPYWPLYKPSLFHEQCQDAHTVVFNGPEEIEPGMIGRVTRDYPTPALLHPGGEEIDKIGPVADEWGLRVRSIAGDAPAAFKAWVPCADDPDRLTLEENHSYLYVMPARNPPFVQDYPGFVGHEYPFGGSFYTQFNDNVPMWFGAPTVGGLGGIWPFPYTFTPTYPYGIPENGPATGSESYMESWYAAYYYWILEWHGGFGVRGVYHDLGDLQGFQISMPGWYYGIAKATISAPSTLASCGFGWAVLAGSQLEDSPYELCSYNFSGDPEEIIMTPFVGMRGCTSTGIVVSMCETITVPFAARLRPGNVVHLRAIGSGHWMYQGSVIFGQELTWGSIGNTLGLPPNEHEPHYH